MISMNALLLQDLEFLKKTNPTLCSRIVRIIVKTTKFQRNLTEDEARFLLELIQKPEQEREEILSKAHFY